MGLPYCRVLPHQKGPLQAHLGVGCLWFPLACLGFAGAGTAMCPCCSQGCLCQHPLQMSARERGTTMGGSQELRLSSQPCHGTAAPLKKHQHPPKCYASPNFQPAVCCSDTQHAPRQPQPSSLECRCCNAVLPQKYFHPTVTHRARFETLQGIAKCLCGRCLSC